MTAACVMLIEGATGVLQFTSVPSPVSVGVAFVVVGNTTAATIADVEWVISGQNVSPPAVGWAPYDAGLTPIWAFAPTIGSAGTWYAWVRQMSIHAFAVSSPIIAS